MIGRRKFNKLLGTSLSASALISPVSLFAEIQEPLKIGQIGTGHSHADGKMETLKRFPEVFDVVGIAEPVPSLYEKNKKNSVYQDLAWLSVEELLRIPNLDGVLIETDLPDLLRYAEQCVVAGLPVHLDKPAGKDLKHFERIIAAARKRSLVLQMGYMFRYNPAFRFALQTVKQGWLGEIFEIDGVISKTIPVESRSPLVDTYQGSMMLLGCHLIDMVVAILGEPQLVHPYRRETRKDWDKLHDNELAVLAYENATATVRSTLVEVEGWERRQFVICGTRGTIEIKPLEPPAVRLALQEPAENFKQGYQTVEMPPEKERYDDQLLDFARMIRGLADSAYSYDHDLVVQKTVLQSAGLMR